MMLEVPDEWAAGCAASPPHIVDRAGLSKPDDGTTGSALARCPGGALLRRGLFGARHDLDHLDRAACRLDRRARTGRDAGNAETELGRQAPFAEQPDAVAAATGDAGFL